MCESGLMRTWSFAKGHGTLNDFVVLKDRHAMLNPTAEDVRFLCNRRQGIGGDGFLRAVKAEHIAEWDGDKDLWFMDYRNADGSIAEMCGNGLRVFVRYLIEENLATGEVIEVATRAGLRQAVVEPSMRITVSMGRPTGGKPAVVEVAGRRFEGVAVDVANPHCVVAVADEDELGSLALTGTASFPDGGFPHGSNVEFVVPVGLDHVRMRVLERGVGETMSCGTGAVAVAYGAMLSEGATSGRYRVDVPGGCLEVILDEKGDSYLNGPAVIVARGEVSLPDR